MNRARQNVWLLLGGHPEMHGQIAAAREARIRLVHLQRTTASIQPDPGCRRGRVGAPDESARTNWMTDQPAAVLSGESTGPHPREATAARGISLASLPRYVRE